MTSLNDVLFFSNHFFILCFKVVSSAIVDKYIGESARLIREMFGMFCAFIMIASILIFLAALIITIVKIW